jgi:ABC-type nitrate/sulfonate/bicarbonate transport system permease component
MFGTMLAEFISTGNGLGFQILTASTNARFAEMWAGVVLITAVTVGLYGIVGLLESLTLHRYAPDIAPR